MNTKLVSCALLVGLGLGSAAAQAAEEGWYVLAFAGQTSASGMTIAQSDDKLTSIFARVGLDTVSIDSSLDDSDTGFGLAGGLQFNDYFAMEFAYVDLGEFSYRADAVVTDDTDEIPAEATLSTKANGPIVSLLGIIPIGERFSVFGRAGISFLQADGRARLTLDGDTNSAGQSSQKTDLVYGVGAEYAFGRYSAVRLSWDRYTDVGTNDVSGDIDADMISLGFRLGVGWFR